MGDPPDAVPTQRRHPGTIDPEQDTAVTRQTTTRPAADGRTDRPPRRLVRRTDDAMVAGVASGVAAYLGLDPAAVRIALVVLCFMGPGVPLYAAGWLLMPRGTAADVRPTMPTRRDGPAFWLGVALLVVAALGVTGGLGILDRGVIWPLVLVGIGVALWRSGGPAPPRGAPTARRTTPRPVHGPAPEPVWPSPATPDEPAAVAPPAGTDDGDPGPPPAWPPAPPAGPGAAAGRDVRAVPVAPAPPGRKRRRSVLGRLTIAVAAITLGVAAALDQAGLVTFRLVDALGLGLIVIGLGLVVGAWFGRARWLVVPGLVLIPLAASASFLDHVDVPLHGGFGERIVDAPSVGAAPLTYALAAGQVEVDLRDAVVEGDEPVTVTVGAGQITVVVPDDVGLDIDAEAGMGEIVLPGATDQGPRLDLGFDREPAPGEETLVLDLRVGAGQIEVLSTTEGR